MDGKIFSLFGAGRLGDRADRAAAHTDVELRLVPPAPPSEQAEADPIWDQNRRDALDRYAVVHGIPDGVPDLAPDDITRRRLARSTWGTNVTILLPPNVHVLPSVRQKVEQALDGRDPYVTLDPDALIATYQLEDGSTDSRRRTVAFARALALLLGGVHDVRISDLDGGPSVGGN